MNKKHIIKVVFSILLCILSVNISILLVEYFGEHAFHGLLIPIALIICYIPIAYSAYIVLKNSKPPRFVRIFLALLLFLSILPFGYLIVAIFK